MGWYGTFGDFNNFDEYFQTEFATELDAGKSGEVPVNSYAILDYAIKEKGTRASAYLLGKANDEDIFGKVILLYKGRKRGTWRDLWGYREDEEFRLEEMISGKDCPKAIQDLFERNRNILHLDSPENESENSLSLEL